MLYEYLKNGFLYEGDWNCAERMLRGANHVYGLGLSEEALKLSAGFGGGMAIGTVCGALTGAIMALSSIFVEKYAHESQRIKTLTREFLETYEGSMRSILCQPLKEAYYSEDKKCGHILLEAAKLFDTIVLRARSRQ